MKIFLFCRSFVLMKLNHDLILKRFVVLYFEGFSTSSQKSKIVVIIIVLIIIIVICKICIVIELIWSINHLFTHFEAKKSKSIHYTCSCRHYSKSPEENSCFFFNYSWAQCHDPRYWGFTRESPWINVLI